MLGENGANRLVPFRIATDLQFIKNTVSARCSKVKHKKTRRHVCVGFCVGRD